jgi:hypothetical protein
MPTHKITKTCYVSGRTVRDSKTYTADAASNWEVTVPVSTTDQEIVAEIDVSQITSLFIVSDGADLLLETNNAASGSRDDYIDLVDGVPYTWSADEANDVACLLTTDVTTIYATNVDASNAATLKIEVLYDSTP